MTAQDQQGVEGRAEDGREVREVGADVREAGPASSPPPVSSPPPSFGGVLVGGFSVLARYGRQLYGLSLRATAVATVVGGIVLAAGLLAAWPVFVEVQEFDDANRAYEDPVVGYDSTTYPKIATIGEVVLPLLLILAVFVIAMLHAGHAVAASRAADRRALAPGELWRLARPRLRPVFGAQLILALVALGPAFCGFMLSASVDTNAVPGVDPHMDSLSTMAPLTMLLGVVVPLLLAGTGAFLGVRLSAAPAAAALEELSAVAALRRSWSVVRGSWFRAAGVAVLTAAVAVAGCFLLAYVAGPLRTLMPHRINGNEFAPNLIEILIPPTLALLITPLVTMPVVCSTLAQFYRHLVSRRGQG